MKIVKISDMSEKEKKELLEKQQKIAKIKEQNKNKLQDLQDRHYQKETNLPVNTSKRTTSSAKTSLWNNIKNIANNTSQKQERTWFQKSVFSDGYQFGDLTKTITGTATDLTQDATKGILKLGENVIDSGAYVFGAVNEKLNELAFKNGEGRGLTYKDYAYMKKTQERAENTRNFIARDLVEESGLGNLVANSMPAGMVNNLINGSGMDFLDIGENLKDRNIEKNSVLGDRSDALIQSGGQLAGTIGLQALGVPWQVTTGISSFGGGVEQAFQNDATYGEAMFSGAVDAGVSIITGNLFKIPGIKATGSGKLGTALVNNLSKGMATTTGARNLINFTINTLGEGAEEFIESFFQRLGQVLSYEREDTLEELASNEEARNNYVNQVIEKLFGKEARDEYGESFIGGMALSSAFGGSNAYNMTKQGRDINTGLTYNEQLAVDAEKQSRIDEQQKNGKKLTKKQIAKIEEEVIADMKNGLITGIVDNTIDEKITTDTDVEQTNPYKNTAKANKLIKEKNNQIRELQSQIEQTNSVETKNELQTKIKQIESEYNNKIQELYDNTNEYANLRQNGTNNQNNTNTQQITQSQQETAQNGISEQTNNNYISEEFKKGLEQFKSGKYNQYDNIVILNETPQWLYNKGFDYEQPIVLNMDKLNTIMKEPKGNFDGKNQHGITMDIIEQLPEAISNPLNVIKNPKYNNRYVIVTHLTDQYGDIVIVPIEMNSKGYIEGIETDVNKLTSTYGKEYYDLPKDNNVDSYMERNKDNIVYDIDTYNKNSSVTTNYRLQLPSTSSNATSNNSVPQNTKNVNSNTTNNYSMQESENNSDSFNLQKFRTTEEIANDTNISDLDAIKEESSKINTPSIESAVQTENNFSSKTSNQTVTSPTIDYVKKKRSKEKASIKEIKDTLAQKFVNKGHYIDKLAKETGNKKLTYLYDRILNVFNEAQVCIGDAQVDSHGNVIGKSIIDIFKPAEEANLSAEFDDYLLNKHNISRYAHEKGIFGSEVSATDSQRIVENYEAKYPQFKEWAEEVSRYNDNTLKDLVNNGLVSQETYNNLREMYGDYVPTYRDITDNISQYVDDNVGGNTLKTATQSDKGILSIAESMAEQTLAVKKAIRINNLGKELYNTLGKNSEIRTGPTGINFDALSMQTIAGDVIGKATDGTNTFTIFQDGEMIQFKISDELYSAFEKDTIQNKINDSKVLSALLTPVEKLTTAQRKLLTTYSVGFAMTNPIKDFQDALFSTKYSGITFMKNYTKALYNIATEGSWYESYKNNGGMANTYFDYNKGLLPSKNQNLITKIGDLNRVLEQAPRLSEYISTIEHNGSIDEALYNSAEITTNFKRGGDITKAVNKYGVNFLNASVQGLDKFYRNLSGQNGWKGYANLITNATLYSIAPAIINALLLGDDEDYEDLPEYVKDNYYLFKMGNGKFFRIPKGRPSSIIGGIARRGLETLQGKDADWSSLVDTVINNMAPNNPVTDNVLAPMIQAYTNKAWYGGEIVGSRLQSLPTAEQYDETTDSLSKFIGEKLNISPKKVNYVLDQYSGGIGDVLLPLMTPQAENNIIADKFTVDAIMKNKHVSEYFSQMEELEKKQNSAKATDEDILKYKYFTSYSKDISDLYKKKREIQNSEMANIDKKEAVRDVQKEINDLVEEKLDTVEDIQINGDIAQVGDIQYYRYKGEWTALSEEEKEKTKGISLKTYADYQNKVAKISEQKKVKDESVTKSDRINILVSSKYSSSEKDKIYSQIIDKDDKVYSTLKKLDTSKNVINQYLDYLQTDLKANREDDGTEKGKAISGSKRQKVYNYINSIPNSKLSYKQRLFLTGVNTTLSDSDQYIIYKLIKVDNSLTPDEKLEVFEQLDGFTVYTNGTIKF